MDVFALTMKLKEEGAGAVKAATDRLGDSFKKTTVQAKAYDAALGSIKTAFGGLAAAASIGALFKKIVSETIDAEYATAQLNAALISTKGAAGQSAEALNAHAQALSYMTAYDDDAITGAQALLLTFTKIQGDVFPKATAAILDMAAAMNTDLKSATLQVGKALNDPILGVSALGRAGVQFSEAQKEVIASLTETGRVAEAQAVILAELKTQFEGSAAAAANTLGGALKQLANEFGNLLTLSKDSSTTTVGFVITLRDAVIGLRVAIDGLANSVPAVSRVFKILGQTLYQAYGPIADVFLLLARKGKEAQDAAKALADAQSAVAPAKSVLADAFVGLQQRQLEIKQLIQLSSVMKLNKSQTQLLRGELQLLIKARDREGLSLQGKIDLATQVLEIEKALTVETKKQATLKLAQVDSIGSAYQVRTPLSMMPFDAEAARAGGAPRTDPSKVAEYQARAREEVAQIKKALDAETLGMAQSVRDGLANALGDALSTGIQAAFAKGANFGDSMKAFGATLLSGLGSVMVAFGQHLIQLGVALKVAMSSFSSGNPYGMIAAGVAILAVGSALKGAGGRAMSQAGFGGGGGGGGAYSAPAMGGNQTLPTATYGPTSAAAGSAIRPASSMNVTIIGPNDPSAQRAMQELMTKADRRGNV